MTEQDAFNLLTTTVQFQELSAKLLGREMDPTDLVTPAIKILLGKCQKLEAENGTLKVLLIKLPKPITEKKEG
jgi:hypothetical protein